MWYHLSCSSHTKLFFCCWAKSDCPSCSHRLYISLLTSPPCQDPYTHCCRTPFLSTCCRASVEYRVDWCSLGENETGPKPCDKFVWPAMTASLSHFFPQVTFNMSLVLLCSDVVLLVGRLGLPGFIRWYVSTSTQLFSQHATRSSAFLVHLAVLSVGGVVRERTKEEGRMGV